MNMTRHKMKLMDFYLYLLSVQHEPEFDLHYLMDGTRDALAKKLKTSHANVQIIFERMMEEDK